MAKTVKVSYNADTLETVITVDGREFDTSRINGKEIADWAYPFMIRKIRWNGFYDEMVEALGGDKEFNLVFEGSEDALAELKEAWEDAPVTIISDGNGENTVLIEYDEDNLKTTITINGQAFDTSRIDGREIADWVYPFMIRKVKWNGIFDELSSAVGSNEYVIQFFGNESCFKILTEEAPAELSICMAQNNNTNKAKELTIDFSDVPEQTKELFNEFEKLMIGESSVLENKSNQEFDEDFKIISHYADLGNIDAMCYNAFYNICSANENTNINVDVDKLRILAEKEHVKSQFAFSIILQNQGKEEAFIWMKKAAENGYIPAYYFLGIYYFYGKGTAINKNEAIKWYTLAADNGNVDGLCALGYCLQYGDGIEQNCKKAVKYYKKAAKEGFAEAQNRLGCCYFTGIGVGSTYSEALKHFKNAADQNYLAAICNLATCYRYGYGCDKNISKAKELYLQAAEQGYLYAQYYLGNIYEYEKKHINLDKALMWYNKAKENGLIIDTDHMGEQHRGGFGAEINREKNIEWYRTASICGDAWSLSRLDLMDYDAFSEDYSSSYSNNKSQPKESSTQLVNVTPVCDESHVNNSGFMNKATDALNKVVDFAESETGQNIIKIGKIVGKIGATIYQANKNKNSSYTSYDSDDYYYDDEY